MNNQNDEIAIVLAGRYYLYELLQHIWGHEPSLKLLEVATSEHTKEALELISDTKEQIREYLKLLTDLKLAISINTDETLEMLKSEYTALMLGPNKLPAPPWESVYLTKERTIFQESTLNVRRIYLKYQFLPANYPHEADDHLALELDFITHLAKFSLERFEENREEVRKLLSDQKAFLNEHLLLWIHDFAKQIQNSKTHHFYPQTAALTEQILKKDAVILDELISIL